MIYYLMSIQTKPLTLIFKDILIILYSFRKMAFTLGGPERPILVQFSRKLNPVGTMTYITLVFNMIGLGINLWMK